MQDKSLLSIATSPTLAMNSQAKALRSDGRTIYRFGFGESPFQPPAYIIGAMRDAAWLTYYGDVQGEADLRRSIAAFHREAQGIITDPEQVFVAPGSKILLFTIMASFKEATVFIPRPAWVSYAPQAHICGHRSVPVETSHDLRWRVTPEKLLEAVSKAGDGQKILILNHPGNPDGMGYTAEESDALAEVCRRHDVLVISDEIYGLLSFAAEHRPMALHYPEATITTTGLSKWCGAGGWRLGVALLPSDIDKSFLNTLRGVCSETFSCTSIPIQMAAQAAYKSYEAIKPYLDTQQLVLRQVSGLVIDMFKSSEVNVHPPTGGFYCFPEFSAYKDKLLAMGIEDSEALCQALIKDTGVALLPGTAFGCDPAVLAARLAYVDLEIPEDLRDFDLARHAAHLREGMAKMLEWLDSL